jgi:hypothetical protein
MRVFLIYSVIQKEGFYVHHIVEKHFGITIAPVRSRGGSLVINIAKVQCIVLKRIAIMTGKCACL